VSSEQATSGWTIISGARGFAGSPQRTERLLLALAGLFVFLGALTLELAGLDHWSLVHWSLVVVWAACFGSAHVILGHFAPERDPLLLPLAGLLTGWGLVLIARLADETFLLRQSIWLVISIGVFLWIATRSPRLHWLRRYRYTWLLAGLALLAATLVFGTNPSGFGPRLWLGARVPALGGVYFQPSEILKLLMVVFFASYLAEKRELVIDGPRIGRWQLPSFAYLGPLLAMWGLAMVLLAWQQDLGAALLFFLTFLVMLYLASGSWEYVVAGLALFVIAVAVAYLLFDTVALRVDIWLNPWADPDGRAFQIVQSLIAFAVGGLLGQGLGQGSPTYIPAIHTDFPFAAIAEEFGLAGTMGLIAAFAVLTLVGFRIALNSRTPFRRLLAAGLAALLGVQAWIIMAGSAKLIPLTGVTLPFVSYGGSSLLGSFIALALLTTISRDEEPGRQQVGSRYSSVMTEPIRYTSLSLLIAFGVLAVASGYWALVQYQTLRNRDDNPRLVVAEQRVRRGPILDRQGTVLARSQASESGIQERIYREPTLPAVGYYSLKHGVGGIEASFDATLRGLDGLSEGQRFLNELLHRQPDGKGVKVAVDANLQSKVDTIMALDGEGAETEAGDHRGAVVLMDVASGEILALASQPTFDANKLDADWEALESDPNAPLLNRVTQGLYQPGGVLQPIVLAQALESDAVILDAQLNGLDEPLTVDGQSLPCAHVPQGSTLADGFAAACPSPLADLGAILGASSLESAFDQWGFDDPPLLEIPTEAGEISVSDPRLAAVGQEELTLTPLHVVLAAAAIGNKGVMPAARFVLEAQAVDGQWHPTEPLGEPVQIIHPDVAQQLLNLLRPLGDGRVLGHSSLALAGADQPSHAWFFGLAPAQDPRYAVAVLQEHVGAEGLEQVEQMGHDALVAALGTAQ
jgi:cell division protein FtsW (lipid II flippase)/cell division protein FtsI/penicillin-binding protein 2